MRRGKALEHMGQGKGSGAHGTGKGSGARGTGKGEPPVGGDPRLRPSSTLRARGIIGKKTI